ncbi:uncharacterized protein LOC130645287 isoform X1 [Hydractinia symbiolongicarpus]|uniref:uncharacterized protein LOC130645287 isoform X1 n=1 Tax=Hydractinia symbiolongicarpus TaxID=13093 RepID=UPI0025504206|nr:uncharacterized protein LOC130645287 isoform X1 [Hydractinia symbiolongicarpus]
MIRMLRQANYNTDLSKIYNLVNTAYEIELGNTGISFSKVRRWPYKIESEKIEKEISDMYVYVDQNEIIGCIKAEVKDNTVKIGPVAVAEPHQRQGVASRMLEYAETLADISKLDIISCRTDVIPYYKKRGYKEVARSPITKMFASNELARDDIEIIIFEKRKAMCKSDKVIVKSDIVKLNVGGEEYVTTISTLTKYQDSMLGAMFLHDIPTTKDEHGRYFIDRDKHTFKYILQFLRCGKLVLPTDFKSMDLLKVEADFYQIKPLVGAIQEYEQKLKKEMLEKKQFNKILLLCSLFGHSLDSQSFSYHCAYSRGPCETYKHCGDHLLLKRNNYEKFSSFLANSEDWQLVKLLEMDKTMASFYLFSIGIEVEYLFRNNITYNSVKIEFWKCICEI